MQCPKCNAGNIRAEHAASVSGLYVFCDNQACFTWFCASPWSGPEGVLVVYVGGLMEDGRITRNMSLHRLESSEDVWAEYVSTHKMVELMNVPASEE